jgi:hypothetical protein
MNGKKKNTLEYTNTQKRKQNTKVRTGTSMQHQQHVRETTKQRNEQLHWTPRFDRTHGTRQHAFLQLQRHFPVRPIFFVGSVPVNTQDVNKGTKSNTKKKPKSE